jgi:hypothetical protein
MTPSTGAVNNPAKKFLRRKQGASARTDSIKKNRVIPPTANPSEIDRAANLLVAQGHHHTRTLFRAEAAFFKRSSKQLQRRTQNLSRILNKLLVAHFNRRNPQGLEKDRNTRQLDRSLAERRLDVR